LPFTEPRAAFGDGHACDLVFLRKFATDAEPEDKATFGQVVEGGGLLGDRPWMAQRQQVDAGAKRHAPADHGSLSQQQQWVEEGQRHGQMIANPKRVKPSLIYRLNKPHKLIDLRQPLAGLVVRLAMDGLDADLEIGIEGQWHRLVRLRLESERPTYIASSARTCWRRTSIGARVLLLFGLKCQKVQPLQAGAPWTAAPT
jgi:hypothetical protein